MTDCHFLFQSATKISIIIPAYNEEERILPLLQKLATLQTPSEAIELIIVDDGSSDRTSDLCRQEIEHQFPRGKLITLEKNSGKGNALRTGVAAASSPVVMTMDADMATDLSAMEPAIKGLQEYHIVVGSRSIEGSQTQGTSTTRRFVTIGFSFFLRLLTRHRVSDTQCGFKAYRSPVAKMLFSSSRVKGFAQDAEILDLAYRHNFSIFEIPVRWTSIPGSKVNLIRDSLSSFLEFIWYRMRTSKTKKIYGVRILNNESKGEIGESEILSFFSPVNIYLRCRSTTDILMPGLDRPATQIIADSFQRRYPDYEVCKCSYTFRDLASVGN